MIINGWTGKDSFNFESCLIFTYSTFLLDYEKPNLLCKQPSTKPSHPTSLLLPILPLIILLPLILGNIPRRRLRRHAQDEKKPVNIQQLQRSEQTHHDAMQRCGLPLLLLPVIRAREGGFVFGQQGPEGDAADEVAEVDPRGDEEGEVGCCDRGAWIGVADAFPELLHC